MPVPFVLCRNRVTGAEQMVPETALHHVTDWVPVDQPADDDTDPAATAGDGSPENTSEPAEPAASGASEPAEPAAADASDAAGPDPAAATDSTPAPARRAKSKPATSAAEKKE